MASEMIIYALHFFHKTFCVWYIDFKQNDPIGVYPFIPIKLAGGEP